MSSADLTTIESNGSMSLLTDGTDYFLQPNGGAAVELSYNGAPVVAGEFAQYGYNAPIAATQTANGYEVAWKTTSGDQYQIWTIDSSGNETSIPFVGSGAQVESYEASFNDDLNGDGTIGVLVAPTIAGTVGGQTTTSEAPAKPFAHVTIGDANAGATDTLTITLGGAGGTLADGSGFSGLTSVGSGVYALSGTAPAITSELDALVFNPNAGAPNTSSMTTFTLSDQSSAGGAPVIDNTTSVIDSDAAVAPTIDGTVGGQTTTSEAPAKPFAHVTIGDANAGATDTLTITLGGAGGTLSGTGLSGGIGSVYALTGTAAAITSELDALIFMPIAGAPNTSSTTTFTLSDLSSAYATPAVDSATSVVDSDAAVAPTIAGTVGGQTTTSEAPAKPFAHVTIGDANAGATDTLTITLGGAGGTLADGSGFSGLTSVGSGVYALSGTAPAITSELDALVFNPNAGAPNTSSMTTFTLSDQSSAGGAPVIDNTTSVIDSDAAVAPTIDGTVGGQTTTSEAPAKPFAHVTIGDANAGATDTLTIALGGEGGTLADGSGFSGLTSVGSGVYALSGTAPAITSELDALVFTPRTGAPNTSSTTTFALSDQSSAGGAPVIDNTTSVIDSDPVVAPTIAGTVGGQTTTSEAPAKPFAHVTVGDANADATDALTIALGGAGGTLADGSGFSGLTSVGSGVYTLSGTAPAITSELDALVFTPKTGAPNTSSTTTFTLSDLSGAGGAPVIDNTTSVIDSDLVVAPTIAGTVGGQTTTSEAPAKPFANVTVGDANAGATDTLTIALGGAGGTLSGSWLSGGIGGVYTLSGTASAITSELEALIFTPKTGAPNTSSTTTFTLSDQSSAYATHAVDGTTSVIDHDPAIAPADILWRNSSGDTELWNSNGSGGFTGEDLGVVGNSWQIAGTGDFNGDGHSDILWRNTNGDADLWNSNGSGGFTGEDLGVVGNSWQIAGTGDFNDDGHSDILWRNSNGDTELWNSNGSGGFVGDDLGVVSNGWQIAGTGDFNGDGHSDILWRNSNGDVDLWNSNGSGGFTGEDLGVVGNSWQVAGTGDFSGNGESSILWRNANGDTALWNPNGSGGFVGEDLGVVSNSWQIAGTGDFSGDGHSGILWRNTNGDTELWNSNGSGGFTGQDLGVVSNSWSVHKIFA